MPVRSVQIGSQHVALDIPEEKLLTVIREPPPSALVNISATISSVLEAPLEFPALRRALTPEDHLAILIQEEINGLVEILQGILIHVFSADVKAENITLLVPPREPGTATDWFEKLAPAFQSC